VQFTEYIQKNLHLYQFRNTTPLSTAATANFTRGELATALRKVPTRINLIPLSVLLGLPAKRLNF
jgi:20S proteasome subunit beta 4